MSAQDTLPPGSVSVSFIADEIKAAVKRIQDDEARLDLSKNGKDKVKTAIETLENTADQLQRTLCPGGAWYLEW